jgi:hypothetical protein
MIGTPIGGAGIGGVTDTSSYADAAAGGFAGGTAQGRSLIPTSSSTTAGVGAAAAVGMLRPFELRPDGDTATDGWTNQAGSASNIYQSIDEITASDSDFVQSPQIVSPTVSERVDLKVRLYEGAALIIEWTHTDIGAAFVDVEQTLTSPQYAAITSFANLFLEFDDDLGNVYRFPVGDPAAGTAQPVKIKYRMKKLVA